MNCAEKVALSPKGNLYYNLGAGKIMVTSKFLEGHCPAATCSGTDGETLS
jgi:hypothetical protein